jgi:hypothetical protein
MEESNLERLRTLLSQHESRLNEKRPDLVEKEARNFLKRLFGSEQPRPVRHRTSNLQSVRRPATDRSRLKAVVKGSPDLGAEISSLALLEDSALWNAAQTKMPKPDSERMEGLHRKQRLTGLSEAEAQELSQLERQYERVILVRTRSASLLEQRGHDISPLISTARSRQRPRRNSRSLPHGG